ncbi:hypothetical protein FRC04_011076 [Tulasnella sp. 424]|nr:hypothetical protein FRC04_011076 [Tulasnella sp. 424]
MGDAAQTPLRQVPQLKLQLDTSPSPAATLAPRNASSSMIANALLSPVLDQNSPIVRALATTAPKDKEFRKLLGLLLANLRNRNRPPPVYDDFRTATGKKDSGRMGSAFNAIKGAVQLGKRPSEGPRNTRPEDLDSDDDEASGDQYSTDETVDHLTQLRDVLIMSERLGWNILSGPPLPVPEEAPTSPRTPFRRRRPSLRRSQSKERRGPKNDDIVDECLDLLEELISEDCRYRVKKVQLSRPPNTLQSVCLDFAQCLLTNQRRNPKIMADIGFAVIPAFTTFPREMHARLLRFFEESVLRGMLDDLSIARGSKTLSVGSPNTPTERPNEASPPRRHQRTETPIVAIQVDEPTERRDSRGWIQWTPAPSPSSTASNVVSTNAPGQTLRIYQLSSLVSPLLAAVLESVDWLSLETPIDVVHRVHRLLEFIVDCKPDAYLDLLEIVAYHTEPVRHAALSVMLSFWPHAIGHAYVGRAFPLVSYNMELALRENRRSRLPLDECAYTHQFMAWGFPTSRPGSIRLSFSPHSDHHVGFTSPDQCHGCGQVIEGFGLICTLCLCAVHIQCYDYPEGQFFTMYPSPQDARMQKVALTRFSHVLPHRRFLTPPVTRRDKHTFRLVNLFTLTLCLACKLPLWGCAAQAMECTGCKQFIHPSCVSLSSLPTCRVTTLSPSTFTVEWNTLRKSFVDQYRGILFEEDELSKCSYEEVSVAYGVLWTQLQILRQGIASGSVLVVERQSSTSTVKEAVIEEWDIQRIVRLYESYLREESPPKSSTLEEYKSMARMHVGPSDLTPQLSVIFEWPLLVYITAILKSPRKAPANPSQAASATFLSVNLNEDNAASTEDLEHPFELVVLSHMRDTLGFELNVFHDPVAKQLLSHLQHCGFFHRLDHRPSLFDPDVSPSETFCAFPLPLVIDYSTSVETLVSAIAVCLDDLSIAVNEVGFIWLTKRCWPNGMASDYAMHRLVGLVVSWIASEDERLVRIARDYVARGEPLPGVRMPMEGTSWPMKPAVNHTGVNKTSARSGNDYLACRRELLVKYAARWLLALYNQDPELYATAVYDQAVELAIDYDNHYAVEYISTPNVENGLLKRVEEADHALRTILKLSQSEVLFSTFDTVMSIWLDEVAQLAPQGQVLPFTSLRRLVGKDVPNRRASTTGGMDSSTTSDTALLDSDPWHIISDLAKTGLDGLSRAIRWLRVVSHSSVPIPVATLNQVSAAVKASSLPFMDHLHLCEIIFCVAWVEPLGRHDMIATLAYLHVRHLDWMVSRYRKPESRESILHFLRYSFAACLLLYGCERRLIISLGLVDGAYADSLVVTRQRASQAPMSTALGVDVDLLSACTRHSSAGDPEVVALVARFSCALFTQPSALSSDAVARYLAKDGIGLYGSAWAFMNLQDQELSTLKIDFLLKLLHSNPQHFKPFLDTICNASSDWMTRAQTVDQLFHLILILNDLSLLGEGSRWVVTPIFTAFLRAIWADSKEEVRLSAQTLAKSLLPAHFATMSACYEEAFVAGDIAERLELALFFLQLLPHFPGWPVISWKVVLEGVAATMPQTPEDKSEDIQTELRVALLDLSLQLVGNGVPADIEVLLIIKVHVAQALGFPSAQLSPSPEGARYVRLGSFYGLQTVSFVLLSGLVKALDSTTTAPLPPSAMTNSSSDDSRKDPYVGAVFIDIALMLAVTADFANLPYLASRAVLDALLISIYKYDITRPALAHLNEQILNAIGKITHTVNMDISYDLRSAALTIAQAFLKKWPDIVIKILSVQIMMCDLNLAKDNLLVAQGTSFLESAFAQFAMNGLFVLLLKYPLQEDFFKTVKHVMHAHAKNRPAGQGPGQSLRETVFSDTFRRLAERADYSPDPILPNLKAFVELVYSEGYSTDLMHDVAIATNFLTRLALDTHAPAFNPNPWLDMCVIIIRHNKSSCSELLGALEIYLKTIIHRFDIVAGSLTDILLQTAPFYRRTDPRDMPPYPGSIVVDVVSEALRGKVKLPTATLASALTALKDVFAMHQNALPWGTLDRMAAECAFYLCTPLRSESYVEASFTVTMVASDLVLAATESDVDVPRKYFIDSNERIGKLPPTVRAWNALLLSALLSPTASSTANLFSNLRSFTPIYTNSLAFGLSFETMNKSDNAALDLDQAFTAIKLWMMLSRRKPSKNALNHEEDMVLNKGTDLGIEEAVQDNRDRTVWNELWPAFENVLTASAVEGPEELTPLTLAIWSSFAELVIFLHLLRSPIALETSAVHVSTLKSLRKRIKNESASSKITRALKCVAEPPTALPLDLLIAQARTELLAGEKLAFAFEKRKMGQDKRPERRKEYRTVG